MPRVRPPRSHDDLESHEFHSRDRRARRRAAQKAAATWDEAPVRRRPADGSESFNCGHCHAFIGPTISGGRHRNHCPLCLYSRHVDGNCPGDRASTCRSLMAPIGVFERPNGEQVILHRCLGCGLERHTRVAADDNPLAILDLPQVAPRVGGREIERAERRDDEADGTG